MIWTTFWKVQLTDWAKELFIDTKLKKIQEYYGLSFEDLFNEEVMLNKWIKKEDLEYVKENREVELATKSKEAWEMKKNLFESKEWIRIKEHYWVTENDIKDLEILKKKWLKEIEINFITWKKETTEEVWEVKKIKTKK